MSLKMTHETHHSEANAKASVHHPMEPDPVCPELGPAAAAAGATLVADQVDNALL